MKIFVVDIIIVVRERRKKERMNEKGINLNK